MVYCNKQSITDRSNIWEIIILLLLCEMRVRRTTTFFYRKISTIRIMCKINEQEKLKIKHKTYAT